MIATVFNAAIVAVGGLIGVVCKRFIAKRFLDTLMAGLALVVAVLGISSAIKTADVMGMIVCLVVGTLIGEAINIEKQLERLGDFLKSKLDKGGNFSTFTEGFVAASLLYCVGSMAIMGAMEAGIRQNYTILLSKSLIDGVSAVSLGTIFGVGVIFAALPVFTYQGLLTLCAGWIAPFLSNAVVNEMSAIGGLLILGIAFNMLQAGKPIRVANMLPAMLLPILYQPIAALF